MLDPACAPCRKSCTAVQLLGDPRTETHWPAREGGGGQLPTEVSDRGWGTQRSLGHRLRHAMAFCRTDTTFPNMREEVGAHPALGLAEGKTVCHGSDGRRLARFSSLSTSPLSSCSASPLSFCSTSPTLFSCRRFPSCCGPAPAFQNRPDLEVAGWRLRDPEDHPPEEGGKNKKPYMVGGMAVADVSHSCPSDDYKLMVTRSASGSSMHGREVGDGR
ncbi:hypothetical protein NDU88_008176 [Pleurodeles waltl]|uniref:Uncharacterized protein n=1 Tax=Pleurodeles waltl TaxID=8319 RepID=A0AAV7RSE7_PLEWA|nr:hypothetical protein NDU88_008176 [Pleurodeles waltl]